MLVRKLVGIQGGRRVLVVGFVLGKLCKVSVVISPPSWYVSFCVNRSAGRRRTSSNKRLFPLQSQRQESNVFPSARLHLYKYRRALF